MPWNKKNSKVLTISIDRDVYVKFKNAVNTAYGSTYGLMYQEWCQAISERTQKLIGGQEPNKHKAPILGPDED